MDRLHDRYARVHVHAERLGNGLKTGQFEPVNRVVWRQNVWDDEKVCYGHQVEFLGPARLVFDPTSPIGPNFPRAISYVEVDPDQVRVDGLPLDKGISVLARDEKGPAVAKPVTDPRTVYEAALKNGRYDENPERIGVFATREAAREALADYVWSNGLHQDFLEEGRDEVFVVRMEKGEKESALSYYNEWCNDGHEAEVEALSVRTA